MDAMQRRPWVDWIHTARDLGALVRGYTKWDDLPSSVPAALESICARHQIAMTYRAARCSSASTPRCRSSERAARRDAVVGGFQPPVAGDPPGEMLIAAGRAARRPKRPLIMIGRVTNDPGNLEQPRRARRAARRARPHRPQDRREFPDAPSAAPFPAELYSSPPRPARSIAKPM